MSRLKRFGVMIVGLVVLCGSILATAPASHAAAPALSTLVAIRAASHPEATPHYDRVVFEFSGAVPLLTVQYVKQLVHDASGLPVTISGNAIVGLRMEPAQAHNDQGQTTAPTRVKLSLPNVKEVASTGDFEGVLSYGIGVDHKTEIRVMTLAQPSRIVVDFVQP